MGSDAKPVAVIDGLFLDRLWAKLPEWLRELLRRSGLPYALGFWAKYNRRHALQTFAGTLATIHRRYPRASPDERRTLSERFDAILDALVLPNGVRKTTYARRAQAGLARFLGEQAWRIEKTALRVLDLPSSSGRASLDSYTLLRRFYNIASYVLADICFAVYYDPVRRCVFDDAGNLLQVQLSDDRYLSIYQPHALGSLVSPLSRLLLVPENVATARARKRYPFRGIRDLVPVALVHPEVEPLLTQGVFSLRSCNVFALDCREEFDLVLSFNLLQRNYFPPAQIELGVRNLAAALTEGGYLLTGSSDAFGIAQKRDGELVTLQQRGEW